MPSVQSRSQAADQGSVVSLFCGCGGLDHGFVQSGFKVELALDHDPAAVVAYTNNLGHAASELDVRDSGFLEQLRSVEGCDVLLGGFPCQGFSKAGPKREADERNLLYQAMITALGELRPKIFVAENVDGLAQNYNGSFLRKIVSDCAGVGYRVEWKILDAAWFGVPQHRRRIAIVGIRADLKANFVWPEASHRWIARNGERAIHGDYPRWAASLDGPRTVKDALAGLSLDSADHDVSKDLSAKTRRILERIPEGRKLCNARHDSTSVRTWDIPEAFGAVTARERQILETVARNRRHKTYGTIPNGNPLSLDVLRSLFDGRLDQAELDSLVERGYLKRVDSKWDLRGAMFASGLYKRPQMDLPSPTVLTVFGNPRFFAHPLEPRPFTVREVARLQSFPDEYEFDRWGVGADDAYRLIGNAVPPLLARHLAEAVAATLRDVGTVVSGEMVDNADVVDTQAVVA